MARAIHRLTPLTLAKLAKQAGKYHDGGGLYFWVNPPAASWVYRYMIAGRARAMGLGPWPIVSLGEARQKAAEASKLKVNRQDPLAAKQARPAGATFGQAATEYIKAHSAGWRSAIHARQWEASIRDYAEPIIGATSVVAIGTDDVLRVLAPIWQSKPETASRLRGRIEAILDYAKAKGLRQGENPAQWKGNLDHLLPKPTKVKAKEHFAAMAYAELPAFIGALRAQGSIEALALEFCILTATRTNEVLGARWDEIVGDLWTIPAVRMKAGKEHRVPLSTRAIEILEALRGTPHVSAHAHVFNRRGRALGDQALRRACSAGVTVHGFRSSFRDWAAECTTFPNDAIEMALAHSVGTKVEQAYRRGDLFEKRRALMAEWGAFAGGQGHE